MEENKVWYQPLNGNAWLGPAVVLCQYGQSVWLHFNGEIRKVVSCRVKPYELLYRKSINDDGSMEDKREVMLEDGLEDMDNLCTDLSPDSIGAKYPRMANSVSFNKICYFCCGTFYLRALET